MNPVIPLLIGLALTAATASAAKAPATWDGLVHVKGKKVAAVYLLPHADFRPYSKVMFDPPQIAFQKNWERDYNRSAMTFATRVSDSDVRKWSDEAQAYVAKTFPEKFAKAGFQVAPAPGPDVLKLSIYVVDMSATAPNADNAIGRTFALDAGTATLAVEARDSLTGQLLGRVVDPQVAGDGPIYRRTSSSNHADFEALFDNWAKISARGLGDLRASSPVDTDGQRKK